jgi:twitching motility protein PilT
VLSQAILPKKPEGLVAAFEMMVVTPAIQNLIRENKVYRIDSSIQTGRKHGMFLLDENLFRLWKEGICDKEEVLQRSSKPAELAYKISQAEKGIFDEEEGFEDEEEDQDGYDDDDDDEEDDRPRRRRR